jgi:hypothetical protein
MLARGITEAVAHVFHLPIEGEDAEEQAAMAIQMVMNVAPVMIQGIVENMPAELKPPVLAQYKDGNGKIKWGYVPATTQTNKQD